MAKTKLEALQAELLALNTRFLKFINSGAGGAGAGSAITSLTGDVTATGPGAVPATLANTAVTPGSYTSTNLTVDAKGRITAAASGTGGTGDVVGPSSAVDNEIPRYDGTTGKLIQGSGITIADGASGTLAGSNSGDVTLAGTPNYLTIVGQVITRALINLASHVTGRLPFANLTAATTASVLLGRRSGSSGDFEEIALGTGLSMSSTTLSATASAQLYMPVFVGGLALTSGDTLITIPWTAPTS